MRGENGRPPEAERLAPGVLCRAPNTVLPAGKLHYLGAVMGQFWRANPGKFSRVPKILSTIDWNLLMSIVFILSPTSHLYFPAAVRTHAGPRRGFNLVSAQAQ